MSFLEFLATDVFAEPALLVGLFALLGLALQRKSLPEMFTGTVKTVIGLLVFMIGAGAATATLESFQQLFAEGFGVTGVVPLAESITGYALARYGTQIAVVMALGLVVNLVVARLTPLKFIFLTGQQNLFFATFLTLVMNAAGVGVTHATLLGGVLLGFFASFFPWLGRAGMRRITGGDDIGIGHYDTIGYALSSWIGTKVGDPARSTESLRVPAFLSFFKDYVAAIAVTMVVFFYVAAFAAGGGYAQEVAGDMHWLVFPLLQALIFAGAVYVMITGIEMLLAQIVPAFVGISTRLVPGVRPALDCPSVFPYAPTAVVIGFLVSYGAGLVMMVGYLALDLVVVIPVAIPYFFIGGTAAVFGNATGGWKGAVAGSAVIGVLLSLGPQLLYPIMSEVDLATSSFPDTDFAAVGAPLYHLFRLGPVAGTLGTLLIVGLLAAVAFGVDRRARRVAVAREADVT